MLNKHAPRRQKVKKRGCLFKILSAVFIIIVLFFIIRLSASRKTDYLQSIDVPEYVSVQIIKIDGASRRGESLDDVRDIVIHYVGNPRTTAQQNHDFYTNSDSNVSSHFIVGLDGEVIQCIPLNEKSSASNWRNSDTISIEVCHPDKTGKFTKPTYNSLVKLTSWLCGICSLTADHVIRHYDITGKQCPIYFVKNEDKWLEFKNDVSSCL